MDTKNLAAELYGTPDLEWGEITSTLDRGFEQAPGGGGPDRHTCWLATIDADGRPHVTGVGALWVDGAFWFETGRKTRKGRNLARDPRCTLSLATHNFDLIVEGAAGPVTDPDAIARMAKLWSDGGWPVEVDESGTALTAPFSAPSAGPPPWTVYRLSIAAATAVATVEPGGAMRWRFES